MTTNVNNGGESDKGLGVVSHSQHVRDSVELRSLCQARDDARRERDGLAVEVADLRAQLEAIGAGGVSGRLGWKLVPVEPTPEIIAAAAIAAWPVASAADIAMAREAAPLVLMQIAASDGVTVDMLAGILATMAPAYRAMLSAAPLPPAAQPARHVTVVALTSEQRESLRVKTDVRISGAAQPADLIKDDELGTKLADAVGAYFRVNVGEHSSCNDPRMVALSILSGEYVTDGDDFASVVKMVQHSAAVPDFDVVGSLSVDGSHFIPEKTWAIDGYDALVRLKDVRAAWRKGSTWGISDCSSGCSQNEKGETIPSVAVHFPPDDWAAHDKFFAAINPTGGTT